MISFAVFSLLLMLLLHIIATGSRTLLYCVSFTFVAVVLDHRSSEQGVGYSRRQLVLLPLPVNSGIFHYPD